MKKKFIPLLTLGLLSASLIQAQGPGKEYEIRRDDRMGEFDEIIIRPSEKGKDAKVVVEIRDGKVTVNGQPLDKFDDKNVIVMRRSPTRIALSRGGSPFRDQMMVRSNMEERAFLGVVTEKGENGVKVQSVSEASPAEKAGLKTGDIITKLNEKPIESPAQLSEVVGTYKPEEKVTVTVRRSGKETKLNAVLGKREGPVTMAFNGFEAMPDIQNFEFKMPGDNLFYMSPNGRPRLGLRAQDTEDGKGVKVLDVDDDSPADKAGLKEDDIITSIDGKSINSADELLTAYKDNKDKSAIKISVLRDGKPTELEVRIPKKLKTANL